MSEGIGSSASAPAGDTLEERVQAVYAQLKSGGGLPEVDTVESDQAGAEAAQRDGRSWSVTHFPEQPVTWHVEPPTGTTSGRASGDPDGRDRSWDTQIFDGNIFRKDPRFRQAEQDYLDMMARPAGGDPDGRVDGDQAGLDPSTGRPLMPSGAAPRPTFTPRRQLPEPGLVGDRPVANSDYLGTSELEPHERALHQGPLRVQYPRPEHLAAAQEQPAQVPPRAGGGTAVLSAAEREAMGIPSEPGQRSLPQAQPPEAVRQPAQARRGVIGRVRNFADRAETRRIKGASQGFFDTNDGR
ncbi:MAG TPA: hypothetical protein VMB52_06425 [Verrucomicrobiae bacterium]|nr:hypothetical protein [Verrucomicrobiae bacterium]